MGVELDISDPKTPFGLHETAFAQPYRLFKVSVRECYGRHLGFEFNNTRMYVRDKDTVKQMFLSLYNK